MAINRKFGYIKDTPNSSDLPYKTRTVAGIAAKNNTVGAPPFPASFSIQPSQPPIWDQGFLGSCVGEGCTRVAKTMLPKKQKQFNLSVLFDYWNARAIEGTTSTDCGAQIRDGIDAITKFGICQQADWPYNENKVLTKPTPAAFKNALKFQAVARERLGYSGTDAGLITNIKDALMSGFPVVFGKAVYYSFFSTGTNGIVPNPNPPTDKFAGGHCEVIVGWNDNLINGIGYVEEANSWGTGFGAKGYDWISYNYLFSNLTFDFWAITKME